MKYGRQAYVPCDLLSTCERNLFVLQTLLSPKDVRQYMNMLNLRFFQACGRCATTDRAIQCRQAAGGSRDQRAQGAAGQAGGRAHSCADVLRARRAALSPTLSLMSSCCPPVLHASRLSPAASRKRQHIMTSTCCPPGSATYLSVDNAKTALTGARLTCCGPGGRVAASQALPTTAPFQRK